MDTNKKLNITLSTVSLLLTLSTSALIVTLAYGTLDNTRHKLEATRWRERAEALEQTVTLTKDELAKAQFALERFTNPIQYELAAAPIYNIPLSEELQEYTYEMCSYYDIVDCYEIILGMMWRESHFKADAVSNTGDYGIMQINECNHDYLRDSLGIVDIMDPYRNIEGGVYIFSTLMHKYEDAHKALMAYNMGSGGAAKHWARGTYSSNYSRDILNKAELIKLDEYSEK